MKEIQLTKGKVALVDDDDYSDLIRVRWCMNGDYAYNGNLGTMHRYVLGLEQNKGMRGPTKGTKQVDHINGNKLDNRKENLRLVDNSQNQLNHDKTKGKSKYRGVIWSGCNSGLVACGKPWIVRIKLPDQPRKYLGSFATEEEAAIAYDLYAKEHCPEFTKLNFK